MQQKSLPLDQCKERIESLSAAISAILIGKPGIYSVAVVEPESGFEWSAGSQPMRAASLIKLFIMAQAFEERKRGRLPFDESLSFASIDFVGGAGVLQQEPAGSCRTVEELVELMITESDNLATNLLIDRIGMSAINRCAARFGCRETLLQRRMMDFAAAADGWENLTSVVDVAGLLVRLHNQTCIDAPADDAMCSILGRQTDRCKIPLFLPTGTVCQHKTGELPGAEHDAGIVRGSAGSYVVAIMSDELPDPEEGRQTVAAVSKAVYDWFFSKR